MAFSLVTHAGVAGGSSSGTTSAVDTSGANLIYLIVSWFTGGSSPTVSDNKGNTYTLIDNKTFGGAVVLDHYYCSAPTVGSGHTFTWSATSGTFASMCVQAWSGAAASSPLDQHSIAIATQPGSLTPSVANCLVVSSCADQGGGALSVNSGFTITDTFPFTGGSFEGSGAAYLVQTTATAENPTWSGGSTTITALAVFKAASVTPSTCPPTLSTLGVGCGIQAVRAMIRNRVVGRRGVVAELLGVGDE